MHPNLSLKTAVSENNSGPNRSSGSGQSTPTIVHITPASASLTHLLKERIMLITQKGYRNIGFSTTENIKVNPDQELASIGAEYIESRWLTRRFSLFHDLMFFFEVMQMTRRLHPDLVITYGPKPGMIARIAAKLAGAETVAHVFWGYIYSDFDPEFKKKIIRFLEQFSGLFSDVTFTVNEPDRKTINRHWLKRSHAHYLGNATDVQQRFNPDKIDIEAVERFRNRHAGSGKIVITLIGRTIRTKGYEEFIAAAKHLLSKRNDLVFWMAGPRDDIRGTAISLDSIEQEQAEGKILYLGSVPVEDMALLNAASDIICLPSWREGFPRSLVEAAAMAKPLIATDINGCREVVKHQHNGLLVPLRDPEALSQAIERLADDQATRIQMGANSRKLAVEHFDQKQLVNRMLSVLETSLNH